MIRYLISYRRHVVPFPDAGEKVRNFLLSLRVLTYALQALELFEELKQEGFRPSLNIYGGILGYLARKGQVPLPSLFVRVKQETFIRLLLSSIQLR
jgi:hypothetical protein